MFSNSKISRRLIVLISALTLTIASIGGVTLVGMTAMVADTKILNLKRITNRPGLNFGHDYIHGRGQIL